ncbi:MAG TPA: MerR family transcriptional regulator [Myxococcales bacterium LLY-WYZ-16_1]|nr:MerR family transcriptional regulator [Myxococcales bacterium LLY-WYZ-16_1]
MEIPSRDPEMGAFYRIGAVAQLTGLSPNTIRTWERRYGAVHPKRSERGGRLYTDGDVRRLQLLKALSGRGDAISTVAPLATPALLERLGRQSESAGASNPSPTIRVAVLHRTLGSSLRQAAGQTWSVVADADSVETLIAAASGPVEALILHLSLLGNAPESAFERCIEAWAPRAVVVVFEFASQRLLEALADAGARPLRAPVDLDILERLLREQMNVIEGPESLEPNLTEPSQRAFDDHQLARLRQIRSTVDCECPHHLAQLVEMLVAFERYSTTCESQNPQDAEIHRTLRLGTGRARMQMEALLARILDWEQIEL